MINVRKLKCCEGYKGKNHATNKDSPCTQPHKMLPVVGWSLKTLRGEWPLDSLMTKERKGTYCLMLCLRPKLVLCVSSRFSQYSLEVKADS